MPQVGQASAWQWCQMCTSTWPDPQPGVWQELSRVSGTSQSFTHGRRKFKMKVQALEGGRRNSSAHWYHCPAQSQDPSRECCTFLDWRLNSKNDSRGTRSTFIWSLACSPVSVSRSPPQASFETSSLKTCFSEPCLARFCGFFKEHLEIRVIGPKNWLASF